MAEKKKKKEIVVENWRKYEAAYERCRKEKILATIYYSPPLSRVISIGNSPQTILS
jgi:hypothetical protein